MLSSAGLSTSMMIREAVDVRPSPYILLLHFIKDSGTSIVFNRFENPTILLEQNIYNRLNNKYFDVGKNGEAAIEIEQAIHLAGQRKKQTKLEKINKDIAQYQFEETLRILHGELNEIFIETYFLQKTIKIYNKEIISLENLLTGMKIQFQKGNISFLEISRLESMLLSLKKEKNEQENSLFLF